MGYDATVEGVTELTDGMKITIIPNQVPIQAYHQLNVNGLGGKYMYRMGANGGKNTSQFAQRAWGIAGVPITLTYSAAQTCWIADVPVPEPENIGAVSMQSGTATSLKVTTLLLTNGTDYGDTLPTTVGAAGKIFFKKVT
jgi:hypothetical protein